MRPGTVPTKAQSLLTFASVVNGTTYAGGANQFNGTKTMRAIVRFNSMPQNHFEALVALGAGTTDFGCLIVDQNLNTALGGTHPQLQATTSVEAPDANAIHGHVLQNGDLGLWFDLIAVADGTNLIYYINGRQSGTVTTFASTLAGTRDICFNGVATSHAQGTAPCNFSIAEVQLSSTALTPAQVLSAFAAGPLVRIPGCTNEWRGQDATAVAWPAALGGQNLTEAGPAPTFGAAIYAPSWHGCVDMQGDSITKGQTAPGVFADGWRLTAFNACYTAGKGCQFGGRYAPNTGAGATYDYDGRHNAVQGQAWTDAVAAVPVTGFNITSNMNVAFGNTAGVTDPNVATVVAWGANDIFNNQTPAQIAANVSTGLATILAARPGRPIVVVNILKFASNGTTPSTVQQRANIDAFNQVNLPNAVAAFIAANPGATVKIADVGSLYTQAQMDSGLVLQADGVHPLPSTYVTMGGTIGPVIASVL